MKNIWTIFALSLLLACSPSTKEEDEAASATENSESPAPETTASGKTKIAKPVPPPPAAPALDWQATFDPKGVYFPDEEILEGSIKLKYISLGSQQEFLDFEEGRRREIPVVLNFTDLGQSKSSDAGVTTTSYYMSPSKAVVKEGKITFEGAHKILGEIKFKGKLHKTKAGADRILKGNLTFLEKAHKGVALRERGELN